MSVSSDAVVMAIGYPDNAVPHLRSGYRAVVAFMGPDAVRNKKDIRPQIREIWVYPGVAPGIRNRIRSCVAAHSGVAWNEGSVELLERRLGIAFANVLPSQEPQTHKLVVVGHLDVPDFRRNMYTQRGVVFLGADQVKSQEDLPVGTTVICGVGDEYERLREMLKRSVITVRKVSSLIDLNEQIEKHCPSVSPLPSSQNGGSVKTKQGPSKFRALGLPTLQELVAGHDSNPKRKVHVVALELLAETEKLGYPSLTLAQLKSAVHAYRSSLNRTRVVESEPVVATGMTEQLAQLQEQLRIMQQSVSGLAEACKHLTALGEQNARLQSQLDAALAENESLNTTLDSILKRAESVRKK